MIDELLVNAHNILLYSPKKMSTYLKMLMSKKKPRAKINFFACIVFLFEQNPFYP